MPLSLVTPPAAEPVTLDEAKLHLRIDHTAEDDLIARLIGTARLHVDGKDGWLNRALVTQTWRLHLDAFPKGEITIPLPPLRSITSVTYLDTAGASQTLAAGEYVVDTFSEPGRIVPGANGWPVTLKRINAVTIEFQAGYGAAADVPETIKAGILFHVGHLYANREEVITGSIATRLPVASEAYLSPYRVHGAL